MGLGFWMPLVEAANGNFAEAARMSMGFQLGYLSQSDNFAMVMHAMVPVPGVVEQTQTSLYWLAKQFDINQTRLGQQGAASIDLSAQLVADLATMGLAHAPTGLRGAVGLVDNFADDGVRLLRAADDVVELQPATGQLIRHPFADGATHITTLDKIEVAATRYPQFGRSTGLYVTPTDEVNALLSRAASRADIEIALGIERGRLSGGPLVRIDISDPFTRGLRLPDPLTGNSLHIPNTGLTLGGLHEAVIDPLSHSIVPRISRIVEAL